MSRGAGGRCRLAIIGVLALLLVQYAVGMVVNLYVTIPARHPGAGASSYVSGSLHSLGWAIAHAPIALAAHTLLGLLLAIATLAVLALSRQAERRTTVLAALGALFTIAAGFNGASFLDYNHKISSLIMSLLFALAVVSYIAAAFWSAAPDSRIAPPSSEIEPT